MLRAWAAADLFGSLEFHLTVFDGGLDAIACFEFAVEQFHRQWIEQKALDGPFQRAGAELRIEAFFGQVARRGGIDVKAQLLGGQSFAQSA